MKDCLNLLTIILKKNRQQKNLQNYPACKEIINNLFIMVIAVQNSGLPIHLVNIEILCSETCIVSTTRLVSLLISTLYFQCGWIPRQTVYIFMSRQISSLRPGIASVQRLQSLNKKVYHTLFCLSLKKYKKNPINMY